MIRDVYPGSGSTTLIFQQCCGSVTFWYGTGSADPCRQNRIRGSLPPDPDTDPTLFASGFQDDNNKKGVFPIFFAYHFLNVGYISLQR
jgi:hypothetical protein